MTIVMSEIMWSKINVSSDNKLLCGLLIILVEDIASPGLYKWTKKIFCQYQIRLNLARKNHVKLQVK